MKHGFCFYNHNNLIFGFFFHKISNCGGKMHGLKTGSRAIIQGNTRGNNLMYVFCVAGVGEPRQPVHGPIRQPERVAEVNNHDTANVSRLLYHVYKIQV